ncbi:VOC family protein [Trichlorobacter lovleyi]|jgi:Predicted enzyme related to lactoylglutathione lyase|uniref:Glyoxalase/bleomycin resistance protein/dioxygenase n=1 Tax=Trichlorobacter lovleyi (strain ATCC BAA-1151 / DSM 17278 / SZ) TaxID=398767 RepID=B3EAR9_TRIL1|nr:glyoxalase superfamily protein [Trichlorobacter lovleyi]ACD96952.1 Glyoxalase/bleomycin resistance protein/dioxygenase [Trichlorobacter lovleyi SZ]
MSISMKNIVLFVTDLQKAKTFYADLLGLPLAGESQMMMEFFPGSVTTLGIALALQDDAKALVGRYTGISLNVKGIDKLCDRLKAAGATFIEPLEESPWGKMAVVADPDGNQFALVEM